MKITFTKQSKKDFDFFKKNKLPEYQKIKNLLIDIGNEPFKGLGKPEALRGSLSGFYSRRITKEHRLVYKALKKEIIILSCRFHYK